MASVWRRQPQGNEVGIEVELVDGEGLANISTPSARGPSLRVVRVPLSEAAVIAVRLSQRFDADIAVTGEPLLLER